MTKDLFKLLTFQYHDKDSLVTAVFIWSILFVGLILPLLAGLLCGGF